MLYFYSIFYSKNVQSDNSSGDLIFLRLHVDYLNNLIILVNISDYHHDIRCILNNHHINNKHNYNCRQAPDTTDASTHAWLSTSARNS